MSVDTCNISNDDLARVKSSVSPGQMDASLRQTLQMLWLMLPKDRRTPEGLETEFRRLVERVLRDFREDAERYGGS